MTAVPTCLAASVRAFISPSANSGGVEGDLLMVMFPFSSRSTRSVNAPPMSLPMMCMGRRRNVEQGQRPNGYHPELSEGP